MEEWFASNSTLPLPPAEGEDTIFEYVVGEQGEWEHWGNRVSITLVCMGRENCTSSRLVFHYYTGFFLLVYQRQQVIHGIGLGYSGNSHTHTHTHTHTHAYTHTHTHTHTHTNTHTHTHIHMHIHTHLLLRPKSCQRSDLFY